MSDDTRAQRLHEFVQWTRQHITGDEKGEAQVFLDRLFQAFGQRGVREAGATQLLNLNLEVARRIDRGDPVTAPGVPPSFGDPSALVTDDCIHSEASK